MRIYKRTTAKGEVRWDVTVDRKDPVTGRRKQERKTFTTRKAAQVWLSEQTVAEKNGTAVTRSATTVSELLALWLQTHKPNVRPSTFASYEDVVNVHLIPAPGTIPVQKLTPQRLQLYCSVRGCRVLYREQGRVSISPLARAGSRTMLLTLQRHVTGMTKKERGTLDCGGSVLVESRMAVSAIGMRRGRWCCMMHDPIDRQQWEARLAYKKGWEVRLQYYDSLLRSMLELLEGALKIMHVDELTEEMQSLGRAIVEIEDAYMALSRKAIRSPLASEDGSRERERERESQVETEGDME